MYMINRGIFDVPGHPDAGADARAAVFTAGADQLLG